jgi:hypothetical protein
MLCVSGGHFVSNLLVWYQESLLMTVALSVFIAGIARTTYMARLMESTADESCKIQL